MSRGVYIKNIHPYSLNIAAQLGIVFNMFYIQNTTFSDTIYVIIMTKYTPECTKLQYLIFFSWATMLALAFSPHRELEVKGLYLDNLSWCHGVGFSKVNY